MPELILHEHDARVNVGTRSTRQAERGSASHLTIKQP